MKEIDELRNEFKNAFGVAELADCCPELSNKLDDLEKKLTEESRKTRAVLQELGSEMDILQSCNIITRF